MFYLLIDIDNTFLDTLTQLEKIETSFYIDNQTNYTSLLKYNTLFETIKLYDNVQPTGSLIHFLITNMVARKMHITFISKQNKNKKIMEEKTQLINNICDNLYKSHRHDPEFKAFSWDIRFLSEENEQREMNCLFKHYDMLIDDAPYRIQLAKKYDISIGMVAYPYNTHLFDGSIIFFKPNTKNRKNRLLERVN